MTKKIVFSPEAPPALGPYSQGVRVGDLLFLAGQIPLDPKTGALVEGIAAQTEQVFANIKAVLGSEGMTFENIVKTTVFMTDLSEFGVMNEIYGRYFPQHPPARSTVQVAKLPKEARVEIEVIAHV